MRILGKPADSTFIPMTVFVRTQFFGEGVLGVPGKAAVSAAFRAVKVKFVLLGRADLTALAADPPVTLLVELGFAVKEVAFLTYIGADAAGGYAVSSKIVVFLAYRLLANFADQPVLAFVHLPDTFFVHFGFGVFRKLVFFIIRVSAEVADPLMGQLV